MIKALLAKGSCRSCSSQTGIVAIQTSVRISTTPITSQNGTCVLDEPRLVVPQRYLDSLTYLFDALGAGENGPRLW